MNADDYKPGEYGPLTPSPEGEKEEKKDNENGAQMDANGYKPGEYGPLTPSPEGETPSPEEEEKKKKNKKSSNKKKALVGLAALLVAGGCCVGSTFLSRCQPPVREETAIVEVMPTNTPYVAPQSPTATEAEQEPVDVREGWYGAFYEGRITSGVVYQKGHDPYELGGIDMVWLEILGEEECLQNPLEDPFCGEDRSWGVDIGDYGCVSNDQGFIGISIFLPSNLSEAPNLTLTEDELVISPTEEYPYELRIERRGEQVEVKAFDVWRDIGVFGDPERWVLDSFTADHSYVHPCNR